MKDYLYVGTAGRICAIDPQNGEEVWRTKISGWSNMNVLFDKGILYAAGRGKVVALDAYTGKLLWENNLPNLGFKSVSLAMKEKSIQNSTIQQ